LLEPGCLIDLAIHDEGAGFHNQVLSDKKTTVTTRQLEGEKIETEAQIVDLDKLIGQSLWTQSTNTVGLQKATGTGIGLDGIHKKMIQNGGKLIAMNRIGENNIPIGATVIVALRINDKPQSES